jgi:bifunctional DNA-binding transcriptional regulator/antitoxin component of YhaV-PrlF toxin-antitoxin module
MMSSKEVLAMKAETRVEPNSQVTLPESVVQAAAINEGARFVIEVFADDPDTLHLQRIRPSYAGALKDVVADPEQAIEAERASWSNA